MTCLQFSKWFFPLVLVSALLALSPAVQAAGEVEGNGNIVFGAIGDFGSGTINEATVSSLVNSWGADFIITLGDNRYGSNSFDTVVGQFYCDYLKDVDSGSYCAGNSLSSAFFPALGNHDYNDGGMLSEYLNYFILPGADVTTSGTSGSERYYDHVQGPMHFFVLDSDAALDGWWRTNSEMSAQKTWLEQQLAASTAAWKVVYLHHAPYSSANHGSNILMQWPFAAWGADAVIAAHDHTYERLIADGIPYFVNGLGGKSIYSFDTLLANSQASYNEDYGAMRVSTSTSPSTSTCTTQMTFEFVNTSGTVIDSYTLQKDDQTTPASGTVYARIATANDDVEELDDGSMYFNSTDLELGDDPINGGQTLGLRFQCLNIPQGATIDKAYLEFVAKVTSEATTNVLIAAEDIDSASAFLNESNNVTSRLRTENFTSWGIPAWDNVGETQQSALISLVVQEVVDRTGWSAGNSMVFVISGTGERTAEAFDAFDGVTATAPRLYVEYSAAPTSNSAPVASFTYSCSGKQCSFTDTSSDSDGTVKSWAWDFGDSNTSSTKNPSHTYANRGNYTVFLEVTDDESATGDASATLRVKNRGITAGSSDGGTGDGGSGGTVEAEKGKKKCNDGIDNDDDGLIDEDDPDC